MTGIEAMDIVHKAWDDAELKAYDGADGVVRWCEIRSEKIGLLGKGATHREAWVDCLKHPSVWPFLIADFELYNIGDSE